jgi:hypothetical protein
MGNARSKFVASFGSGLMTGAKVGDGVEKARSVGWQVEKLGTRYTSIILVVTESVVCKSGTPSESSRAFDSEP